MLNRTASECTFIIRGQGKAGHRLQAVGAGHHQRTRAPLRLGAAGRGPRSKAINNPRQVEHGNQNVVSEHILMYFF